jgi:hypothetical protein
VANIFDVMGLDESAIDMIATKLSLDTLSELERLAIKHEVRREEIVRELERRRRERTSDRRSDGKLSHKDDADAWQPLPPTEA